MRRYYHDMNDELKNHTNRLISTYIKAPKEKPATALFMDAEQFSFAKLLKEKVSQNIHLFGASLNRREDSTKTFDKFFYASSESEMKCTNQSFSFVYLKPEITRGVFSYLEDHDNFNKPDFYKKAREKFIFEGVQDEFDFDDDAEMSEEELLLKKEKAKEDLEKKIEKRANEMASTFNKAAKQSEDNVKKFRKDFFLLNRIKDYIKPGGLLVFVTPIEMIDATISKRLSNQYRDISIFRDPNDDDEKFCIIFATKRSNVVSDTQQAYELSQYKYKKYDEIPELEAQMTPVYDLPAHDPEDIRTFRIGPITEEEILQNIKKSKVVEQFNKNNQKIFKLSKPSAPAPLHDGHIMLLLTSGLLNGYIGSGVDKHLVKGSVHKKTTSTPSMNNRGDRITIEKEYYDINIKYLDRYGSFHTIM